MISLVEGTLRFLIVAGPTAVGKTDFALELAAKWSSEIINADVFQMYRGFDILAAKPEPSDLTCVRHHLLSFLKPQQSFDSFRFANLATRKIRQANRRGIIPLVVGGSGFYLQSLTHPLPDALAVDWGLRGQLSRLPVNVLLDKLREADPLALARIDQQNPRRIVRALEMSLSGGRLWSALGTRPETTGWRALVLECPRPDLHRKIEGRVDKLLRQGAVEEVADHAGLQSGAARMIGFAPIRDYLNGNSSFDECREKICVQTRQYARRQITWFRSQNYQWACVPEAYALANVLYEQLTAAPQDN